MNILVTGGASGFGNFIVKKLAKNKSLFIYFTYNKSYESAIKLEKEYDNVKSIKLDFTEKEEVNLFLKKISTLNLTVLVNNAITSLNVKKFHMHQEIELLNSFHNNVLVPIMISKVCLLKFKHQKFGRIINILSETLFLKIPPKGFSEYNSNKAYLEAMSKSWKSEYSNFGIDILNIYPSMMKTNLILKNFDIRFIDEIAKKNISGEFQNPIFLVEKIALYIDELLH